MAHLMAFLLMFLTCMMVHPLLVVSDPPRSSEECMRECEADRDVRCIACGLESIPTGPDCERASTLELTSNNIRELRVGVFSGFDGLERLVLTDNQIQEIRVGVFSDLRNLNALMIERNNLTSLRKEVFQDLGSLDRLILTGNQITGITTGVFRPLTLTTILAVDNNHIQIIQSGAFQGMTQLSYLRLEKNRLSKIVRGTFSGLGELETLDLSYNQIATLEVGAFEGLGNLQRLKLNSNCIASVAAIVGLPMLSRLTLAENDIQSLGNNQFLQRRLEEDEGLTEFTIEGNPLSCNCPEEALRLWYRKHPQPETTDTVTCVAPANYAGRALADIQVPLQCERLSVTTTSNPYLVNAQNPDSPQPLLSTPAAIIVTIVTVGLLILSIGVFLVLRRHGRELWAQKEAGEVEEEPDDPNQARGYSTFVTRGADAPGDALIGQTPTVHVQHALPNANGHVFHNTEQESSSFLPRHSYLPVEELNPRCDEPEDRPPSTIASPPPGNSSISPGNSLEPDVQFRVDFDEQGLMSIVDPGSELDTDNLDSDQYSWPQQKEVHYAKLDHSRRTPDSRPSQGVYIAPRDLPKVGYMM